MATLAASRMDLLLAALIHYDMEFPMLLRFLGGNFLGLHRDPDVILPRLRGIVDPKVCDDLERILRTGTPNQLTAELPKSQFETYWRYGNHPSFRRNEDAAVNDTQRGDSPACCPFPLMGGLVPLEFDDHSSGFDPGGPREVADCF